MDIVILFISILILSSLGYVIYKFNDKGDNKENTQQRVDEINQMKEMLTLEFKNLANEIFEEKTKKITDVNKENLSNILDPLKENIARFERKVESSNNCLLYTSPSPRDS